MVFENIVFKGWAIHTYTLIINVHIVTAKNIDSLRSTPYIFINNIIIHILTINIFTFL